MAGNEKSIEMALRYKTQGVILQRKDVGEAHRVFTVFTKEFGKVLVWAVSERKIGSKLRGGLELFSLSHLEFVEGKERRVLVEAICLEQQVFLKNDLRKIQAAQGMCEFLDRLVGEEQGDLELWDLLRSSFAELKDHGSPKAVYSLFVSRALEAAGYGARN
ncbi:MAG: DNA repair protein RecO [Candidatus Wildermuthbacteria bacterium]|nr:DNA repair protein RecO [Candidatus Wildermuthbacteria bacterium]